MRLLHILISVVVLGTLVGCARHLQPTTAEMLHGTWYETRTGDAYDFTDGSLLIVPHAQAGGGNAVTYSLVSGDRLDIQTAGSHRVSNIVTITPALLVLADPASNFQQRFVRDSAKTDLAKSLQVGALTAASQMPTLTTEPMITWVAPQPQGKGTEWTLWMTTSIDGYAQAWDWASLKPDRGAILTTGTGDSKAYTFSFTRKVPTEQYLRKYAADTSIEASAGLSHIDIGYSASKAAYPAGELVYLPGGLIYSLGNGYALAVTLDPKSEAFMPVTHN